MLLISIQLSIDILISTSCVWEGKSPYNEPKCKVNRLICEVNGRTQLLLTPTLNVAFRSFEPQIVEPFPNEQLLRKKKIAAFE